jgi:hypothetical protein
MHWQWLTGPSAAFMAAALVVRSQGVSEELERVVGILVPLVAALLSPLVVAIVFLFRQLLVEMRANREMAERMGRVVHANTVSSDANTRASDRLAESVATLGTRIDTLERSDIRRESREKGNQ